MVNIMLIGMVKMGTHNITASDPKLGLDGELLTTAVTVQKGAEEAYISDFQLPLISAFWPFQRVATSPSAGRKTG